MAAPDDAEESAEDHTVVVALGTANDRRLARLRAGEATSVVLLRATMSGLATCPLTEPLEIAETRDAVQPEVFADHASPQMLLRIGWAPNDAAPLPLTPRRPIREVVRVWTGRYSVESSVDRRIRCGARARSASGFSLAEAHAT